jgi:hypothetical protein
LDYILLNINRNSVNYVDDWIKKRNIAPIFYGKSTINEIINNPKKFPRDASMFINTFLKINNDVILFSIGNSNLYIYKQMGIVKEYNEYNETVDGDIVKGIKIEILKEVEIKKCPLILITVKSNRYMSSGTFRKLNPISESNSYFGNILSIQYLLTNEMQELKTFRGYLFCLSSLEFETLIAKMFEEKGYFVPAYKGGFIKNYDLFCTKDDKTISLQIKLEMELDYFNESIDYFYCINNNMGSEVKIKNWKNIEEELEKCPNTKKWLSKTLHWVKYKKEI